MATKNHNPMTHMYYYLRVERWKWMRFKSVCAQKGRSMRGVLVQFIDAFLDANE